MRLFPCACSFQIREFLFIARAVHGTSVHFRIAHYVSIRALPLLSGRLAKEQAVGVASKDLLTAWERKKMMMMMMMMMMMN